MSTEDVVTAGLAQGEVICIPALEERTLHAQVGETQRQFFGQARSG